MLKENIALKSIRFIFRETIVDILYFPVWWYTIGLQKAFKRMLSIIMQGNEELGLSIWVKNIFKPMYGQTDWQGRLISFFMRVVQIIFRLIIWLGWVIFGIALFLFWIILPLFIISQILINLGILDASIFNLF